MQALADAVSAANDLRLSCPELTEASTLLQHVRRVTLRAAAAIRVVDREAMETVVHECEAINLRTPDVAQIKALLQLPPDEFLQHRLGAAVALNDADRVASITMDIKVQEERLEGRGPYSPVQHAESHAHLPSLPPQAMFFKDCGDLFQLHKYPNLKPPQVQHHLVALPCVCPVAY